MKNNRFVYLLIAITAINTMIIYGPFHADFIVAIGILYSAHSKNKIMTIAYICSGFICHIYGLLTK